MIRRPLLPLVVLLLAGLAEGAAPRRIMTLDDMEPPRDVEALPARRSGDEPVPPLAAAWADARVGDSVTLTFKAESISGQLRAEVLKVGPVVTVGYEVTGESFATPLTFRVEVDRARALPRGVTEEVTNGSASTVSIEGKPVRCDKVTVTLSRSATFGQGSGCRSTAMPFALMDGWLEGSGYHWELQVQSATRGAGKASASFAHAPVLLAPFAWAYEKEASGDLIEVASHRRYSIRGFVVDGYLLYPMSCNLEFCAALSAEPLGGFVGSVILDVARAAAAEVPRGATSTEENLVLNGQSIRVRTVHGTSSAHDSPVDYVTSTAVEPLTPGLDKLMWSLRHGALTSGSPQNPAASAVLKWGVGRPAALPLVRRMQSR